MSDGNDKYTMSKAEQGAPLFRTVSVPKRSLSSFQQTGVSVGVPVTAQPFQRCVVYVTRLMQRNLGKEKQGGCISPNRQLWCK